MKESVENHLEICKAYYQTQDNNIFLSSLVNLVTVSKIENYDIDRHDGYIYAISFKHKTVDRLDNIQSRIPKLS